MDTPDFDDLTRSTVWSRTTWEGAWDVARYEVPHHQQEAVWEIVVKLSSFMSPQTAILAILGVM